MTRPKKKIETGNDKILNFTNYRHARKKITVVFKMGTKNDVAGCHIKQIDKKLLAGFCGWDLTITVYVWAEKTPCICVSYGSCPGLRRLCAFFVLQSGYIICRSQFLPIACMCFLLLPHLNLLIKML